VGVTREGVKPTIDGMGIYLRKQRSLAAASNFYNIFVKQKKVQGLWLNPL
jgi:hypothetical protein